MGDGLSRGEECLILKGIREINRLDRRKMIFLVMDEALLGLLFSLDKLIGEYCLLIKKFHALICLFIMEF